jgi:hypothetical protein
MVESSGEHSSQVAMPVGLRGSPVTQMRVVTNPGAKENSLGRAQDVRREDDLVHSRYVGD